MRSSWRRIIPLVADGLEVMSGNCLSDELFAQVISIIPESCRLFSPARPDLARWRNRLARASCAGDYSSRSFPQVGWAAGVYRLPSRAWVAQPVYHPQNRLVHGFRALSGRRGISETAGESASWYKKRHSI